MRVIEIKSNQNKRQQKYASFSGIPERLAKSVPNNLLKSKNIHSFCKMAEENASLFDVSFALIMGTTLGTAGILALPKKKKEDKQYMASQLIMNCAVTFALALAVYVPLSKAMGRLGKKALTQASKTNAFPYKAGTKEFDSFNYLVNYGSRFILAPIQAFLIVKGITPLFEKVFKKDKQGGKA